MAGLVGRGSPTWSARAELSVTDCDWYYVAVYEMTTAVWGGVEIPGLATLLCRNLLAQVCPCCCYRFATSHQWVGETGTMVVSPCGGGDRSLASEKAEAPRAQVVDAGRTVESCVDGANTTLDGHRQGIL